MSNVFYGKITLRSLQAAVFAGLLVSGSVAANPWDGDAFTELDEYLNEHAVQSDNGWRAGAFQVGEDRYMVVQAEEGGDIYPLAHFDGMHINSIEWRRQDQLELSWTNPEGWIWASIVDVKPSEEGLSADVSWEARIDASRAAQMAQKASQRSDMGVNNYQPPTALGYDNTRGDIGGAVARIVR